MKLLIQSFVFLKYILRKTNSTSDEVFAQTYLNGKCFQVVISIDFKEPNFWPTNVALKGFRFEMQHRDKKNITRNDNSEEGVFLPIQPR